MKTKYQLSIQEPQNTIRTFGTLYEVQMDTKDRLLCVSTEQPGGYSLPAVAQNKFSEALNKESLFRRIGTTMNALNNGYRIFAKDCEDVAMWVPEGGAIPIYEGIEDFTEHRLESYKLAAFVKLDEEFIHDASFNMEKYLIERLAKNFSKGEGTRIYQRNRCCRAYRYPRRNRWC